MTNIVTPEIFRLANLVMSINSLLTDGSDYSGPEAIFKLGITQQVGYYCNKRLFAGIQRAVKCTAVMMGFIRPSRLTASTNRFLITGYWHLLRAPYSFKYGQYAIAGRFCEN